MNVSVKKIEKKYDIIYSLLLALFVFGIVSILFFMISRHGKIYGSETDWINQHVQFADYLRNTFYETGNIYPDFMSQLGGGQSAIQLTYYGLFRPEILLSYLFPFIDMKTYFMISGVVILLFSVEIFYFWLRKEKISNHVAFFVGLLFACAGPLLFHTHRHLMFINYIPWLILAFWGIDNYVTKRKSGLMIFSILMIFLSSFFFGVSCLFICGIYAIYCILKNKPGISFKDFFIELMRLLGHVIIAMMLTCFLILPTAISMMGSHRDSLQTPTLLELLKPRMNFEAIIFEGGQEAYSAGMTAISIIALYFFIYKRNMATRVLGILILIVTAIPIFSYILNGLQYARVKPFITLMPLLGYMIAVMMEDLKNKKNFKFFLLSPLFILPYFYLTQAANKKLFLIDVIMIIALLMIYMKTKYKVLMMVYIILPFYALMPINKEEDYLTKEKLAMVDNESKINLIKQTLDNDDSLYRFDDLDFALRTSNQVPDLRMKKTSLYSSNQNYTYNQFFYQTMKMAGISTNNVNMLVSMNPYFQNMMSVKYIYSKSRIPYGYEEIANDGENGKIIKNENVLPMAYVSSNLMSEKDFNKLSYPYTMEALYQNTIISGDSKNTYNSEMNKVDLGYTIEEMDDSITVKKVKNGYKFKVTEPQSKISIRLNEPINNQLLIVDFSLSDIKNSNRNSTKISINGIINKIGLKNDIYYNGRTNFAYVLSRNKQWDKIDIELSKGEYTITNPETYIVNGNTLPQRLTTIDQVDFDKQSNAILEGTVNVKENGYFVTSIPYQDGFEVTVDGKPVDYEMVDTAFIGFPIDKGMHHVVIGYQMPGKKLGIMISVLGLICCLILKLKKYYFHHRIVYTKKK